MLQITLDCLFVICCCWQARFSVSLCVCVCMCVCVCELNNAILLSKAEKITAEYFNFMVFGLLVFEDR